MKKFYPAFAAFVAITMSFLTGCSKDLTADLNTEQLNSCNDYEIPVDDALKTLSEFLETESLTTKSTALSNGEFIIEKWPQTNSTKVKQATATTRSVYCIEFCNDRGSAIMAADTRLSDKILSVTDTKITATDLDAAEKRLQQLSFYDNEVTDSETLNQLSIKDWGETFAIDFVCRRILVDERISGDSRNTGQSTTQTIKYGPFLTTKWGQAAPFNQNMNGASVGCGPVAAAQLLYFFRVNVEPREKWSWDWDLLSDVYSSENPYSSGSNQAQVAAADFMSEVKYRCNMKPSDTQAVVGNIKRCLKSFGFTDVKHDFAHFGGDAHDIQHINDNIEYMIKCGKPVIVLSGAIDKNAGFMKWITGHVFVLDGYKKDNTGEYLHINWGWYGKSDGYYAKGCFDMAQRHSYDSSYDTGETASYSLNFNFFHYYVYF